MTSKIYFDENQIFLLSANLPSFKSKPFANHEISKGTIWSLPALKSPIWI